MAISYVGSGLVAVGTTSLSVPFPAGLLSGDVLVLCICNKYPNNSPSTPAGWTFSAAQQIASGGATNGIDTGSTYTTIYYKLSDGTESGNLSVTITSGNAAVGRMFCIHRSSGIAWDIAFGTDGTGGGGGTTWDVSPTITDIKNTDFIIAASGPNTDNYTYTNEALSASGGSIGVTSETERQDSGTTNGQDCGLVVSTHVVTVSLTGQLHYSMTSSGSAGSGGTLAPAGGTVIMRLRESYTPTGILGGVLKTRLISMTDASVGRSGLF